MKTKFTFLAILLLTFLILGTIAQTNVSGFISANTNWTLAGSPYIITGNTVLDSGIVLTINPGVIVKFDSAKSLQINGNLRATGNSSNKIIFTSNAITPAPGDWAYILFSDKSQDYDHGLYSGSVMEYCIVEYAGESSAGLTVAGTIRISASFPVIRNCELRYNSTTGIIFYNDPNSTGPTTDVLKISRCYIHDNNSILNLNSDAGGIDITMNLSKVILDSNIISNNKARYGGGITCNIANAKTSKIIKNSIIGNFAQFSGGGIMMNAALEDFSYNLIYGNSAHDGAGIYENAVMQLRTIYNNVVVNNTSVNDAVFVKTSCDFTKNTIVDNTASSSIIAIWGGNTNSTTSYNTITRNTLTGSSSERAVSITSPTVFKNNNVYGNDAGYEVYTSVLQSTPSLNIENCWWNTIASAEIDARIYDFLDNSSLTIADYSPFAASPDTLAPVTPPTNVIKTDLGGGKIKITWNANMEADLAGYKIYWGSPTGYSFASSSDAGNVTTDTLTGILITDTVAVSAYDNLMNGIDDQFDGNESWYTYAVGKPIVKFSAISASVCSGETVYFEDNTADATSWSWSFPEGIPAFSVVKNPKIVYNNTGKHNVKLKVTNIAGTDSITYNNFITVKSPSYTTLSPNVCNTGYYTSPSGISTWYVSGIYQDTIPNHAGCDSILTINLTLSYDSYASISPAVCNSYVSPGGNHTWTSNGTYYDTIPNYHGCDSIISINLTVYTIDTSVTFNGNMLTSNANGVNYRWLDCSNGFSAVPGANLKSFTPSISGNFAVEITQSTCIDTSSCYQVTLVGIDILDLDKAAYIYPNPASDIVILSISSNSNSDITMNIYNVMGALVKSEMLKQNHQQINIGDLCNGIYMVEIISNVFIEKQKLIIQR